VDVALKTRTFWLWTRTIGTYLIVRMPIDPVSQAAEQLGERIRDHRNEQGLSQEKLAQRCNVHWTFLGQIERGQRNLRLNNLLKIADGLKVDPGELVRGLKPQ